MTEQKYYYSSDGKRKFWSYRKYQAYEDEIRRNKIGEKLEKLMEEKDMEKQKQIEMNLKISCVGSPTLSLKDGRTKCSKILRVYIAPKDAHNAGVLLKTTKELGWSNLKTLGARQYFCPKCASKILDMRREMKFRWG